MLLTLMTNLGMFGGVVIPPVEPAERVTGGRIPWHTEEWHRRKYEKWPLPPPAFPVEEPSTEVLAFGTTPETENKPAWTKHILKKPLNPHKRLVYAPKSPLALPSSPPRKRVIVKPPTSIEKQIDVSADEIIKRWKRSEEEEVILMLAMQGELYN